MATTATTSNSPSIPETHAVPVDPGIIAGTSVVGFVALSHDEDSVRRMLQRIQANLLPAIGWSDLVLLKLLVPGESHDIIVSHFGNDMLQSVVQGLLTIVRTRV